MKTKILTSLFLLALLATPPLLAQTPIVQSKFAVQIASLSNEADAETLTQQLQAKGLTAYWVRADVPGQGVRYRVRIGQFKTRAEAGAQAERWRAQGLINEFLVDLYATPSHLPKTQKQVDETTSQAGQTAFEQGEAFFAQGTANGYQQALEQYLKAVELFQQASNQAKTARAFHKAGFMASMLGENQKALEYFGQALLLFRAMRDRGREAATLSNLGLVYDDLGEKRKALEYYEQALPLLRAVRDRGGEAATLNNLGSFYYALGENQKALEYFGQALPLLRAVGDRGREGMALNNLGSVYSDLGERRKALGYYKQALPLLRAVRDRGGEAMTLNNLGNQYSNFGEKQKALEYYEQALPLWRAVGDRGREAGTLSNLGLVYDDLGEKRRALGYFGQALPLFRAVGDRGGEAKALDILMSFWEKTSPPIAVLVGKQSVNRKQELRAAISGLDKELQRSFLKQEENTYRKLSDILISLGRLTEAQQVLDLLKEEEYFEYIRRDGNEAAGLKGRATLTPTEARLEKEYAEIADRLTVIGKELEDLNKLKQPAPAQVQRRTALEQQLTLASDRFQAYFARLQKEFGDTKAAGERLTGIEAGEGFQDTLRALGAGTVAIYTVVGEQKYSVILTPAVGPRIAAETVIPRAELNRKIFALKEALKNPRVDPRPLAAELYDILIKPIAKNLAGAKAETLMFSLDGALRYLPMAALYDRQGKQYLIERYRVVMYTPAGATDLKNAARRDWRGLGFGVSKAVASPDVGQFKPLPGVPAELRAVIRAGAESEGVMQGQIYLDEQFTETRFVDALRPAEYPLIHIASHFAFRPGDSLKSFLLLGDGKGLTLERVQKNSFPLFSNVDLLALSACDTGLGEKDNEGREVEGFGVLAQRKGAKAVLATLWAVADESTAKLMREFYRLREADKGMNKAEALRQAQLRFLHGGGTAAAGGAGRTSAVNGEGAGLPKYEADAQAPWAHPYYWAPFILIGNWQ